jgi:hypothetical protein
VRQNLVKEGTTNLVLKRREEWGGGLVHGARWRKEGRGRRHWRTEGGGSEVGENRGAGLVGWYGLADVGRFK